MPAAKDSLNRSSTYARLWLPPPTSLLVADTLLRHSHATLCCTANWLRGCSDTPYFRVAVLLLKQREPVRTLHLHREVCLFSLIGSYH